MRADEGVRARERVSVLERELELLRAQNTALRRDGQGAGGWVTEQKEDGPGPEKGDKGPEGGRVLGSGDLGAQGGVRSQLHAKWEAEKRLQSR